MATEQMEAEKAGSKWTMVRTISSKEEEMPFLVWRLRGSKEPGLSPQGRKFYRTSSRMSITLASCRYLIIQHYRIHVCHMLHSWKRLSLCTLQCRMRIQYGSRAKAATPHPHIKTYCSLSLFLITVMKTLNIMPCIYVHYQHTLA